MQLNYDKNETLPIFIILLMSKSLGENTLCVLMEECFGGRIKALHIVDS